jgi:hypothetical protein
MREGEAVTPELAIAEICGMTPLTENDVRGLLACPSEGLEAIVRAYRDAGAITERSTWDRIIDVLKKVAEFVGIVMPIVSAVGAVFAL